MYETTAAAEVFARWLHRPQETALGGPAGASSTVRVRESSVACGGCPSSR